MLDIKFIRENQKVIEKAARDKGVDHKPVAKVIELDKKRCELLQKVESLRASRNKLTRNDIAKGREIKIKLKKIEPDLKKVEAEYKETMLLIPSVPDKVVPVGKSEEDNKVIKTWGEKPKFSTKGGQAFKPKDHIELGESLNLLDVKRGTKVGGFRGYFLKNEAVLMQMGIMQYAMGKLVEKGFKPMIPPMIVKRQSLINTGHFPWGEVDIYKTFDDEKEKNERFLAGTAEVPLVSFHADETLREKDLPILYAGFSSCYRREIGSYGRDTKGIYRVHEFMKIEQVVICKNELKESLEWLEKLSSYSEEMLEELELPYRKMMMCTGDMGEPQIKKYDIETWMPGRNSYGETMSNSFVGEFQARRANIKYRTKGGEIKFVHMLNNTALACPRILIAIFENYQQEDGSIKVPKVLQKYVNKKVISAKGEVNKK
ncbi:serine--tRNA ligase [Patescibacteria group bacterium]|nr:serine--tRNA ligase [Patescibacteria group bacterium]